MSEKLEILLQYSTRSDDGPTTMFVFYAIFVVSVIVVIGSVIWQTKVDGEYESAIKDFEADPASEYKRDVLIEAAKVKGRGHGSGRYALEVMSLIENARDKAEEKQRVEDKRKPKTDLVAELNSLGSLRERGLLTDEEFELAKAKLLK